MKQALYDIWQGYNMDVRGGEFMLEALIKAEAGSPRFWRMFVTMRIGDGNV